MSENTKGLAHWDATQFVYHATSRAEWDAAKPTGEYRPGRFDEEGFTHCSSAAQVGRILDWLFRGRADTVLLVIQLDRLDDGVLVYENLEGGDELFPHIYGPLPVAAVSGLVHVPLRDDGSFDLGKSRGGPL